LGVNAQEAKVMLAAVERAGVKHAYGSTSRYAPVCRYARQLLAGGLIGQVREIESTFHVSFSPLLPYSWLHSLALGGGALNNILTHMLGQVRYITGGKVTAVAGEARRFLERAPVGEPVHDFRTLFGHLVRPDETTEWRAVDADQAYTVLTQIDLPGGTQASGLFKGSGMADCRNPGYLAFYGERGTLHLSGGVAPDHIEHFDPATGAWQALSIPPEVIASLPQLDDTVQRDWNQLFREFVADVQDNENVGYPTFHEGWLHNELIDIVRSGRSWTAMPTRLPFSGA
jgi:predicted dehydrogenase